MKSHNFCPECGKSLNKDKTKCPNCGILLVYEPIDDSKPFGDLSINDIIAIINLIDKSIEKDTIPRVSKKKKPLIKKMGFLDKVYNMLKSLIESKFLSESEKETLNNELEVISLRLKGVAFLQTRIDSSRRDRLRRKIKILLEETDYEEGLKFFQQAFELSSISQQEISKADLNLVKKIFEQQDKRIALHYLNEISDHTKILIGEIFRSSQFLLARFSKFSEGFTKHLKELSQTYF
jgi:tetratricopeptide (TPR) repeat protein